MRDINRIKPILEELEKLWLQEPDMRLGQLIFNIHWLHSKGTDLFFTEDDQWLEWIKNGFE